MALPRLVILGHGKHGKDTACNYLRNKFGFQFVSSSLFVLHTAVWPYILRSSYASRWKTPEEAFVDRNSCPQIRAMWYTAISLYNADDPARLTRELFEAGNDIYCGLRNVREFSAARDRRVFDFSIWIDASLRLPLEPPSSITVTPQCADFVVSNNTTPEDFERRLYALMQGVL